MRGAIRFLIAALAALALLAAAGYLALRATTREWFERDLGLRANLAVLAARKSLQQHWSGDRALLTATLEDITADERILGSAACTRKGEQLAATSGFPAGIDCARALELVPPESDGRATYWSAPTELPAGRVFVSVVEVPAGEGRGLVVLVHDLRFQARREATTFNLFIVGYLVVALGLSLVTLIAARFAWRGWTRQLRRALAGQGSDEFKPLVRDVRSLVEQLAQERSENHNGPWSPNRLRGALKEHLEDERVVILANREPYIHNQGKDGITVTHPASGLVTALEPVMRACSGVWVAHGSGSADRATVDKNDRVKVPPGEESYSVRRVWLNEAEENGYYYGFSNEGLWPLCHLTFARPTFRAQDFEHYQKVNKRFADAVCDEVDSDDPVVLVQDYHFALAPRMIRERLPRATILTFWHIPWPNSERFGICPWREELIQGLLGSSIVGFHTRQHCNNFIESADLFLENRIDREANAVVQGGRQTLIRPYPISIEWPVKWLENIASIEECRSSVRKELNLPPDTLLGVGVDRLDYTKGIEERLLAVDELLTQHAEYRGKFVFVQLAAPSRTKIDRYQELNNAVEAAAKKVNDKWGNGSYQPIVLFRAHHEPPTVFRYYRAADVCYVSSLHDGMNLVAKEFVAARDDERGVLVLSQFTGAARDLTEALIVNPYDLRQAGDALAAALKMALPEQRERMRSMRKLVSEFNVYRWAGRMLIDAAELRRRERMTGRIATLHEALSR